MASAEKAAGPAVSAGVALDGSQVNVIGPAKAAAPGTAATASASANLENTPLPAMTRLLLQDDCWCGRDQVGPVVAKREGVQGWPQEGAEAAVVPPEGKGAVSRAGPCRSRPRADVRHG